MEVLIGMFELAALSSMQVTYQELLG